MTPPIDILLFSEDEEGIIGTIVHGLEGLGRVQDLETIGNNRAALEELARAISLYPSILESHQLGSSCRSVESLVAALCEKAVPDMILHIPTKAILGRGYSIAKINFFIMLKYIVCEIEGMRSHVETLNAMIAANVFGITAEEVYISIIEDMSTAAHIRSNAAYLLAHTWEYRLGYEVREFAPILGAVWKAREKLIPNFGTMLGFSELFLISDNIETAWFDFLLRDRLSEEEIYALEEFIFGLTYEEIISLRAGMAERGKTSLSREEVDEFIESKHMHEYSNDDPRDLYRSFRDRKLRARYRARARLAGPQKTLEEYLMCFLLAQPET